MTRHLLYIITILLAITAVLGCERPATEVVRVQSVRTDRELDNAAIKPA